MKIALFGYGKMGRMIARIAQKRRHKIHTIYDPKQNYDLDDKKLEESDICIDFSEPSVAFENIKLVSKFKRDIVIGTTGWLNQAQTVAEIISNQNNCLIYGSNFSVGMNVFFKVNDYSARLMNKIKNYDVYGYEMHHNQKMDSPSGTAKTLSKILLKNIARKSKTNFDKIDRKIEAEEIHFASVRAGDINGTHVIGYDSSADAIELKHRAKNRTGFALGALLAAEFQVKHQRKGVIYFEDIFEEVLEWN